MLACGPFRTQSSGNKMFPNSREEPPAWPCYCTDPSRHPMVVYVWKQKNSISKPVLRCERSGKCRSLQHSLAVAEPLSRLYPRIPAPEVFPTTPGGGPDEGLISNIYAVHQGFEASFFCLLILKSTVQEFRLARST